MRYVFYCVAGSFLHNILMQCGWVEQHRLVLEHEYIVKLVKLEL